MIWYVLFKSIVLDLTLYVLKVLEMLVFCKMFSATEKL
jgi:hypothetical protein